MKNTKITPLLLLIFFLPFLTKAAEQLNKAQEHTLKLMLAAEHGDLVCVSEVLQAGHADINIEVPGINMTPLHQAVLNNHSEVVRALLSAKALHDTPNRYGDTPLHTATNNKEITIMELLIAANANLAQTNNSLYTPLHIACEVGSLEAVQTLLDAKANVEGKTDRDETLFDILQENKQEMIALLQRHARNDPEAKIDENN